MIVVKPEKKYLFEESGDPRKRLRTEALHDVRTLLERLDNEDDDLPDSDAATVPVVPLEKPALNPHERNLLVRYCTEVTLNIRWYERASNKEQLQLNALTALIVFLGIVYVAALVGLPFLAMQNTGEGWNYLGAQVGTLLGGGLVVLELVVKALDTRGRVRIFWEAASELKERLYTFENTWRGKVFGPDRKGLQAGFMTSLHSEMEVARALVRKERIAFFETLANPTGLVSSFKQGLMEILAKAPVLTARPLETATAHETRLSEAKAVLDSARTSRDLVVRRFPDDKDLIRAQELAVIAAEADLQKVRSSLGLTIM